MFQCFHYFRKYSFSALKCRAAPCLVEKQSTYSKEKIVGLLSSYELPCVTESTFSLLTADTTDAEGRPSQATQNIVYGTLYLIPRQTTNQLSKKCKKFSKIVAKTLHLSGWFLSASISRYATQLLLVIEYTGKKFRFVIKRNEAKRPL